MPMKFPTDTMSVTLVETSPDSFTVSLHEDDQVVGELVAERKVSVISKYYPDVYEVTYANVDSGKDGFGPLLYDVAMEFATFDRKGGLTSDKNSKLTDEAKEVWRHYYTNRYDVASETIGRAFPKCLRHDQDVFLSTVYYAENKFVIDTLESSDKLRIVPFDEYEDVVPPDITDEDEVIESRIDYADDDFGNDMDLDEIERAWFFSMNGTLVCVCNGPRDNGGDS